MRAYNGNSTFQQQMLVACLQEETVSRRMHYTSFSVLLQNNKNSIHHVVQLLLFGVPEQSMKIVQAICKLIVLHQSKMYILYNLSYIISHAPPRAARAERK